MVVVYLALGSNLGKREQNLFEAIHALNDNACSVRLVSSIYETEAKYVADQPHFINMAIQAETDLSAMDLLILCKDIEKRMGRDFTEKRFGPRVIDIDILFYGSEIILSDDIVIPHPRIAERRFVLEPLSEISAEMVHPGSKKTVKTLLNECRDTGKIRKINSSISGISH